MPPPPSSLASLWMSLLLVLFLSSILYAEWAARASFFLPFFKVWCGRDIWFGISFCKIWHSLHPSLNAEMYSQVKWCFSRLCCFLLRPVSGTAGGARETQQVGEQRSYDGGWGYLMVREQKERWPFLLSLTQWTRSGALWWGPSNAGKFPFIFVFLFILFHDARSGFCCRLEHLLLRELHSQTDVGEKSMVALQLAIWL